MHVFNVRKIGRYVLDTVIKQASRKLRLLQRVPGRELLAQSIVRNGGCIASTIVWCWIPSAIVFMHLWLNLLVLYLFPMSAIIFLCMWLNLVFYLFPMSAVIFMYLWNLVSDLFPTRLFGAGMECCCLSLWLC